MSLAQDAITRQDWENPSSLKERIQNLQSALRERAKKLSDNQQISLNEYTKISNNCQNLLDLVGEINSRQFNQVLTDINEPAQKIIEATNSLDKAAAKIQGVQNFFDIFSSLIRLGEAVSNAISGGGVAAIGNLVKQLKDTGDRLNT
ncbi:hypothetical protein [Nostoc sp. PCC 9305]|uniref:hypothetical protein n=1 Tax=Nostoc sp. PCC 9305 TaxID=296636 RepID=UPI0039C6BC31